ncbi:MAG: helix-turn-helix domain-containing protein [Verrucomicrobiota bacterium]
MDFDAPLGDRLRDARRAKDLSLDDVAHATKIQPNVIDSLENADNSVFPTPLFLKSFLRQYADFLNVDVEPLLEKIDVSFEFQPDDLLSRHEVDLEIEAHNAKPEVTVRQRQRTSSTALALQPLVVFLLSSAFIATVAWTFFVMNEKFNAETPAVAPSSEDSTPEASPPIVQSPPEGTPALAN